MSDTTTTGPDALSRTQLLQLEQLRGDPVQLSNMRDRIAQTFGIRIDPRRLEPQESADLLALHKEAIAATGWEAGYGTRYGLTSKLDATEQARWRELVSKAAGHPGLLDKLDEDLRVVTKIRELLARAERNIVAELAEPGCVQLPRRLTFEALQRRELSIVELGMIVFVSACLENGTCAVLGGYVEGEGDERVLVLPREAAIGRVDPEGVAQFSKTLALLADKKLVTFSERGQTKRIGYGPRLLKEMRAAMRKPKPHVPSND